jgi:hypothetical protein
VKNKFKLCYLGLLLTSNGRAFFFFCQSDGPMRFVGIIPMLDPPREDTAWVIERLLEVEGEDTAWAIERHRHLKHSTWFKAFEDESRAFLNSKILKT